MLKHNINFDKQMEKQNMWWGYRHTSGTYQAKRYFDSRDTEEAEESPFVEQVVYPFPANSRDEALEVVKSSTT